MKKRMLALAMILILVLTSTVFAYAEVEPRNTALVTYDISRISRTSATATVDVTFSTIVDRYDVKIYLQKKIDGQWVLDTDNVDYAYYNSGTNSFEFIFNHIYTDLEAGVNYRLRCVSRDYIGNNLNTFTTYSNQF